MLLCFLRDGCGARGPLLLPAAFLAFLGRFQSRVIEWLIKLRMQSVQLQSLVDLVPQVVKTIGRRGILRRDDGVVPRHAGCGRGGGRVLVDSVQHRAASISLVGGLTLVVVRQGHQLRRLRADELLGLHGVRRPNDTVVGTDELAILESDLGIRAVPHRQIGLVERHLLRSVLGLLDTMPHGVLLHRHLLLD